MNQQLVSRNFNLVGLMVLFSGTFLQGMQDYVMFLPKVETYFCRDLYAFIKERSYEDPKHYHKSELTGSKESAQLLDDCYSFYDNNYKEQLPSVSKDQLDNLLLMMTRSENSSYQKVEVGESLSHDTLKKCLNVLKNPAIATSSHRPCPDNYIKVRVLISGSFRKRESVLK